jgi:hypothetical protein
MRCYPARQPGAACARAYTPREQKAVKVAAETFRPNPAFDCLRGDHPAWASARRWSRRSARRACPRWSSARLIRPPSSRLGPITEPERAKVTAVSPVAGQYDEDLDRDSAFEMLARRAEEAAEAEEKERLREEEEDRDPPESRRWTLPGYGDDDDDDDDRRRRTSPKRRKSRRSKPGYRRQTVTEAAIKSDGTVGCDITGTRFGPRHSRDHQEGLAGITPGRRSL